MTVYNLGHLDPITVHFGWIIFLNLEKKVSFNKNLLQIIHNIKKKFVLFKLQ